MRKIIFSVFSILFSFPGFSQYLGGDGEGFSLAGMGEDDINNQVLYCHGGTGEGFHQSGSGYYSPAELYCTGGDNDGSAHISTVSLQIAEPVYCLGGENDGFKYLPVESYLFNVLPVFSGGIEDGHTTIGTETGYFSPPSVFLTGGDGQGFDLNSVQGSFYDQIIFRGGDNEGFTLNDFSGGLSGLYFYCLGGSEEGFAGLGVTPSLLGRGIWLGTTSNSWNEVTNWNGNAVPDITTDVYIPSGCLFYPLITTGRLAVGATNGAYFCNSLYVGQGGSLNNNRYLYAYGEVKISGLYEADNNLNNTIVLFAGGKLTVKETGLVKIGNQSGGNNAISDMKIDGGEFRLFGGTIEIDDEFNMMAGDLTMTSGTLFVNKYGRGSAYDDLGPGAFYISPAASGTVSGGTIKIVGHAIQNDSVAVKIASPAFDFTGESTIAFVQGDFYRSDNVDIKTIAGARLNKLVIDAPGRNIIMRSNATFHGAGSIGNASKFTVYPGKTVVFLSDP